MLKRNYFNLSPLFQQCLKKTPNSPSLLQFKGYFCTKNICFCQFSLKENG